MLYKITKFVLEIDNVQGEYQFALIQFIIDNKHQPETFWETPSHVFKSYLKPIWALIDGKLYNEELKRFEYKNGNEEIAYRMGFLITWEFVQQVLELEKLECIEIEC